MRIIRNIRQMRQAVSRVRRLGKSIGFVPTMGALHKGHASLISKAVSENDFSVVSIFVNPTQFGPKEDLKEYPRTLKSDLKLCGKERVDIIFHPDAKEMYPSGYMSYVSVEGLSGCLCATSRPEHFKGVATVVAKLFNIVGPDISYFGQKDAQQAVIIKKMVEDLNIPVRLKVMPTIRENDGLAMSSRNNYLNQRERQEAVVMFHALSLAKDLVNAGIRDAGRIIRDMKRLILSRRITKIDYISIVHPVTLKPVSVISGKCLVALAVWFGKTRLIDNIILNSVNRKA